MGGLNLFSKLPEGCISHIISFTSPRDACRSSAVCSIFRAASESDSVWERFLPPDCPDALAGSVSPPVRIASKKELFFRLCDPVLIDDNEMSFSIEKRTGRKCYTLSARKLWITWGDTPMYWKWTSLPESSKAQERQRRGEGKEEERKKKIEEEEEEKRRQCCLAVMLWLVLLLVPAGVGAGAASACSCCCCVMMMMLMLLHGALAAARCCFEICFYSCCPFFFSPLFLILFISLSQ